MVEPGWNLYVKEADWLHDVGYSRKVARTGFHPLDGARWLCDHGWPAETCRLVACHTEAIHEARLQSLDRELEAEFQPPPSRPAAALAWADLTSSATGERCDLEARVASILDRYPPDTVVHQAALASLPAWRAAVEQIEDLIEAVRPVEER